jgi:hypothetical protein
MQLSHGLGRFLAAAAGLAKAGPQRRPFHLMAAFRMTGRLGETRPREFAHKYYKKAEGEAEL